MAITDEPDTGRPVRIGLMGMYASRNLGDMAIQLAVMGALKARRADIEFIGLCQDPADTVRSLRISAMASSGEAEMLMPVDGDVTVESMTTSAGSRWSRLIRRFTSLWRIRRTMRELDMLLISGSGQIDDFWGGPWAQPYNMMVWSQLARRQKKPVAVFGVGVDELSTRLGAQFCLRALNAADICVVRDPGSREALKKLGYRRLVDVCPDPAFRLSGDGRLPDSPPFAVVSPISRRAWPGVEDESYDHYLTALAQVADQLLSQGIDVRYVCSQIKMDPPLVTRVRERMKGDHNRALTVEVKTVDDYVAAVAGASVAVVSRLHAMILAMVAGTPVVAISAVRKVHQQFADMGMPELVFDMGTLDITPLLSCVQDVVSEPEKSQQRVLAVTREFREQLEARFDRLAALIPAGAAVK